MANGQHPIMKALRDWPKWLVAGLVLSLLLAPLLALLSQLGGQTQALHWPYVRSLVRFTLWQALLSTLLSAAIGLLLARMLARRSFHGRTLLLSWLDACFVMPSLVVVLAVVMTFRPSGSVGQFLGDGWRLYGLNGILLAHVFLETPLFVRVFLARLQQMPAGYLRQARLLGFNDWQMWRLLDWPAIKPALPSVLMMVFLLCLTSFTVVLSLGGGPRATTLEVAIYQALRFEFDPIQAVKLALLQLGLAASLSLLLLPALMRPLPASRSQQGLRPEGQRLSAYLQDALAWALLLLLWLWPIWVLLSNARWPLLVPLLQDPAYWQAVRSSLLLGLGSAGLTLVLSLVLLGGRGRLALLLSYGILLMPAVVLATGSFLLIWPLNPGAQLRLGLLILLNALLVMPFAVKMLRPAKLALTQAYGRQMQLLGMNLWQRWRWVYWPCLLPNLGQAFGLCFMLAIADLAATLLLATPQMNTLALMLYRLLGSHQLPLAIWLAFSLVVLGVLVNWAVQGMAKVWGAKRYGAGH